MNALLADLGQECDIGLNIVAIDVNGNRGEGGGRRQRQRQQQKRTSLLHNSDTTYEEENDGKMSTMLIRKERFNKYERSRERMRRMEDRDELWREKERKGRRRRLRQDANANADADTVVASAAEVTTIMEKKGTTRTEKEADTKTGKKGIVTADAAIVRAEQRENDGTTKGTLASATKNTTTTPTPKPTTTPTPDKKNRKNERLGPKSLSLSSSSRVVSDDGINGNGNNGDNGGIDATEERTKERKSADKDGKRQGNAFRSKHNECQPPKEGDRTNMDGPTNEDKDSVINVGRRRHRRRHVNSSDNGDNNDDHDDDHDDNVDGGNDPLSDKDVRARYMATYHARPSELDRKAGARTAPSSLSFNVGSVSNHIFGEKDIGANNDDMDKRGGKATATTFASLGTLLHPRLVAAISSDRGPFGYNRPTVVQQKAITSLLSPPLTVPIVDDNGKGTGARRHNLFLQSETGSGKTLAYLLPIVQSLAVDPKTGLERKIDRATGGTRCLIICPTRELATQTSSIAERLCQRSFSWIVSTCLSGGEKRKSEKARLRKGVTILIATPGRLLDHVDKTDCLLKSLAGGKLEWLVLDEADRLLDMGLGGQVENIVGRISRLNGDGRRGAVSVMDGRTKGGGGGGGPAIENGAAGVTWRSVLVSATVTDAIEGLAKKTLGGSEWKWARASAAEKKWGEEDGAAAGDGDDDDDDDGDGEADAAGASPPSEAGGTVAGGGNCWERRDLADATPRQLAQLHMIVSAKLRLASLVAFLSARAACGERVVVFMSTCDGVDYHHALFSAANDTDDDDDGVGGGRTKTKKKGALFGSACSLYRLHGNVPHSERLAILKKFAAGAGDSERIDSGSGGGGDKWKGSDQRWFSGGSASILFATDVAARGLNLPGVDWTVQYDPPCETADYVHRAGRTARAGRAGRALLFLLPSERSYLDVLRLRGLGDGMTALSLESTLREGARACPDILASSADGANRSSGGGGGGGSGGGDGSGSGSGREGEAFAFAVQKMLEECVVENDVAHKEAERAKTKKSAAKRGAGAKKRVEGPLLVAARKAFLAYIRAYPAKEKAVRHIFSARALHLGHVAKSFALKEPPKALAKFKPTPDDRDEMEDVLKSTGKKRNVRLAFGGDRSSRQDGNMTKRKGVSYTRAGGTGGSNGKGADFDVVTTTKKPGNFSPGEGRKRHKAFDSQNGASVDAQKRMITAAKQLQSGGMEFF